MPLTTETGFANIHGGRLYWEAAGEGEPLVFVHGFTLDTRMWDDQWEVFAQSYRVYRYDARGFGKSSLPEGRFSHSDDLRALMDVFGVGRFHLVGLSMGGSIGVEYAVSHPGDLLSLTLIDAGSGGRLSTHARSFGETVRTRGMAAAKEEWLNDGLFIPARRDELVKQRLEAIVESYSGWHWSVESIEQAVAEPPSMQRLHEIVAPALVMVGELDVPRMQDNADALSKIPGARKVVIADAGHMANMEKPAEVNERILAFLASLPETRQE